MGMICRIGFLLLRDMRKWSNHISLILIVLVSILLFHNTIPHKHWDTNHHHKKTHSHHHDHNHGSQSNSADEDNFLNILFSFHSHNKSAHIDLRKGESKFQKTQKVDSPDINSAVLNETSTINSFTIISKIQSVASWLPLSYSILRLIGRAPPAV